MKNSICQRNLVQNFIIDGGAYRANVNQSILTSRQSRLPSFKNPPPISTPSSPKEQKMMWKTNIGFQNDLSFISNRNKSPGQSSQKKSYSPQLYSITRKPFQLQLGGDQQMLNHHSKSKEKRPMRNSIYS
ncbi:unnamed protein product [Paramecium primaurelia]|uniref:Uncharacterized protein n=1 Tax=Paramecium primaurelia TaxID=5886 RepID=A0A8S1JSD9_PARPR|nr:unnamed protein product [Paramecium primaurelia]